MLSDDSMTQEKSCELVYSFTCKKCQTEYVGETARSLGTRFKEHRLKTSEVTAQKHIINMGHQVSTEDLKVMSKEDKDFQQKNPEVVTI